MANIVFTDSAANYIQSMIEKDGAVAFRLSIKKTGCSGYSYQPSLIKEVIATDKKIILNNKTIVFLDTAWLHLLENITVDYQIDTKSGLKQKKLVFENPSESSRCGCGESFHVESVKEKL